MTDQILGPICSTRSAPIDEDTMCRSRSPLPGPLGMEKDMQLPVSDTFFYTRAAKVVVDVPFSIAPGMTWDAFWRLIYDRTSEGLQRQATMLLDQRNITAAESRALVDGRNELLVRIRSKLSPFGELYSEILKPRNSLKTFEQFLAQKGTIEAVLRSVGKTRAVVDKIGVVARIAGPATIVLEVSLTAVVIQQANMQDRNLVASREIGGLFGSVGGGLGGMWAGCASAAVLASPSLTVPVVGEVTTGGACLVGGMFGGLGIGWLGRKAGEAVGEGLYHIANRISEFRWVNVGRSEP